MKEEINLLPESQINYLKLKMEIEIKHQINGSKGSFELHNSKGKIGEMTYVWAGEDKFIIDHTEVNPDYKGEGLGSELINVAVKFAREKGAKILPLCPYAKKQLNKDEQYTDVLF
jgi:predicted GNAT family acetyltransferase